MHEDEIISADPDYWIPQDIDRQVHVAVTADGAPIAPPVSWFQDPGLNRPTALVVEPDGRVYGHIACWDTKHIGMPGAIKPPRSKSNYAFFATGAVHTAEGQMVNVGQITLVGGHAPIDVDVPRAVAHYDDTQSGVCDVSIGEDRHGIWVAGALRPDVDDRQIRQLRASAVSGDWRPINGNLELVAVCSVNVPGFPIPRARVASGQTLALVAAGVEPLIEDRLRSFGVQNEEEIDGVLAAVARRIERLEGWILSIADPDNSTSLNASAEVPRDLGKKVREVEDVTSKVEDLRRRVRAPMIASLRQRVHDEEAPLTAGVSKRKFVPDLHPRGRDGRFIKKFGFIKFLDGRDEKAGRVLRIDSTPGGTRVSVREDKTGELLSIDPDNVLSAYEPKASLNPDESALTPEAAKFMDLLGESIPANPDNNDIETAIYGLADEDRMTVANLSDDDLDSISRVAGPGLASKIAEVMQDAIGYDQEMAADEAIAMDMPNDSDYEDFDERLGMSANTLIQRYEDKVRDGIEDADVALRQVFDENPELVSEIGDDTILDIGTFVGQDFAKAVLDAQLAKGREMYEAKYPPAPTPDDDSFPEGFDPDLTMNANTLMALYSAKADAGAEDVDEALTDVFDENPELARMLDDVDLEMLSRTVGPGFASVVADKMSEVIGYDEEMAKDEIMVRGFPDEATTMDVSIDGPEPENVKAARDAATADSWGMPVAVFPGRYPEYEWDDDAGKMVANDPLWEVWSVNEDGSKNGGRGRFKTQEEAEANAAQINKLTGLRTGTDPYYTETPIEEQRAKYEELNARWGQERHLWQTLEDFAPEDREDAAKLGYWAYNRVFEDPMQASAAELRFRIHGETDREAIVASTLRRRVHGTSLVAGIKGKFNPNLHPRGKDGKFIEKMGFVKFLDSDGSKKRGRVVGIDMGKDGKEEILVETKDGKTFTASPDQITQAAVTKADLAGNPDAPKKPTVRYPDWYDAKLPTFDIESRKMSYVPLRGSIRDHLAEGGETEELIDDKRVELHEAIIAGILDVPTDVEEPEFLFLGGGPASGKSSIVKSGTIELPPEAAMINADEVKDQIPEYNELRSAGEKTAAGYTHEESSLVASQARTRAVQQKSNVVLDGTGNSDIKKMRAKIEDARSRGYKVRGRYVTVPTDVALARSEARAKDPKSDSYMRWVPPDVIEDAHISVTNTTLAVLAEGLFDDFELYDTNGASPDDPPRPILRATRDSVEIIDQELWEAFVNKGTDSIPPALQAKIEGVTAAGDEPVELVTPSQGRPPSDHLYAMVVEIVLDTPREESRFIDEPWFDEKWNILTEQIADVPEGMFVDAPYEIA